MKHRLGLIFDRILLLIQRLNPSVLPIIEDHVALNQGKGWGSESLEQEVSYLFASWRNLGKLSDPVIFDVGANNGDYTNILLRFFPNSKIYSFEPSHTAHGLMKERFANCPNVKVVNLAVGSRNEFRILYSDSPGSKLASLSLRNLDFVSISLDLKEEVEVTRLDTYCEQEEVSPDIIKLDIEGFELEALEGSLGAMARTSIVQFEFGGAMKDTRVFFADFWKFFRSLHFELFRISPNGLIAVDHYDELQEHFRTTNYLAIRRKL